MSINVTNSAFSRVCKLIELENNADLALRISVDGGGCSGFIYNYSLIPVSKITEEDLIIEQDNTKIVIDNISQEFMADCEVNFVQELGSSYFEIKNPNAKTKCGCGNSFAL